MRSLTRYAMEVLMNLHREDSGQDLVEYGLIAALVALGATAGMGNLATAVNSAFSIIGARLLANV